MKLCECGCGGEIKSNARFLKGHNFNIRKLSPKICPVCGKEFHPRSKQTKCCSIECFNKVRSKHRRTRVNRICEVCGMEFEVRSYRANAKYCSKECWAHRNPPDIKTCLWCNTEFSTFDRIAKFCSKPCADQYRSKYYIGDKSGNWKGGTSLNSIRGKLGADLIHWRKEVYRRDNYTCQKCGYKGKLLQAHHIKPFADYPESRLDINNGITVCISCHEKIHGKKISSPGKFPKNCIECGKPISGKGYYCRSCGTVKQWERQRHLKLLQEGQVFFQ